VAHQTIVRLRHWRAHRSTARFSPDVEPLANVGFNLAIFVRRADSQQPDSVIALLRATFAQAFDKSGRFELLGREAQPLHCLKLLLRCSRLIVDYFDLIQRVGESHAKLPCHCQPAALVDSWQGSAVLGCFVERSIEGVGCHLEEQGELHRVEALRFSATSCPASIAGDQNADYMARAQAWYDRMTGATAPTPTVQPTQAAASSSAVNVLQGTYRVAVDGLNVRDRPSVSGNVVATYSNGQTVNLDHWSTVADGYIWGRYTAYSGAIRYIALAPADKSAWYLVKA